MRLMTSGVYPGGNGAACANGKVGGRDFSIIGVLMYYNMYYNIRAPRSGHVGSFLWK